MRHADKNRCPERARDRAKADARCALRKLEILPLLEAYSADPTAKRAQNVTDALADALIRKEGNAS